MTNDELLKLLDHRIFNYELDVRTLTNTPTARSIAAVKLEALRRFRQQIEAKEATK